MDSCFDVSSGDLLWNMKPRGGYPFMCVYVYTYNPVTQLTIEIIVAARLCHPTSLYLPCIILKTGWTFIG
jgi:hypothetical protein